VKEKRPRVVEPLEFANFKKLVKGLVAVPKKEAEIEEERWRGDRLKKKKSAT
jgi:hypothetical protein